MKKREVQTLLNYGGPAFTKAWDSMVKLELQEDYKGRFYLLDNRMETVPGFHRPSLITDIPTMDRSDEDGTDNQQTKEEEPKSTDVPTTDKAA